MRLRRPLSRRPRALLGALALALLVVSPDLPLAPAAAGGPLPSAAPLDGELTLERLALPAARFPDGVVVRPLPIATAPTPAPVSEAELYQRALVEAHDLSDAFGVSVALVRDGAVLWAGANGTAQDGQTSLTAESPMVVGSVTKTFVAAAILQLAHEGRLSLDDPVTRHLPDVPIGAGITVRQLLNHTSGLADVFNDTTRRGIDEHPETGWAVSSVLGSLAEPWYEPGEGYAYANTNYLLLALIVETLSGASLADELARRFLDPIGLNATALVAADDPAAPLDPAWATIFFGSGAMVSSALDLALWGDALYDGGVLSAPARGEMLEFHSDDHGLGVQRIELSDDIEGYGHTGLLHTYTTLLVHLPEHNVTIALLVNRSHVDLEAMLAARPKAGPSLLKLALGDAGS